MTHSLEIATTTLFLLLSLLLLASWSWALPELWAALDMRVAVGTVLLTSLGLGWALGRGQEFSDPDPQ